ncbi:MAG TPA: hypothetical protein DCY20_08000 [Firmicutes bacterium]|nr:hypothetical protein [Bacillota bacterium]
MKHVNTEKKINKIDNAISALNTAKKYLSNGEEINKVVQEFNRERQLLVNELYANDHYIYPIAKEHMETLVDQELGAEQQKELLEYLKESFGRNAATDGKTSTGLNAWLKKLNVVYTWKSVENSDWATLIITDFNPFKK